MSIQRHGVTRRYSDSAIYGNTVYLVEVPSNLGGDITAQAEICWPVSIACCCRQGATNPVC